jgi:hypothetical protein
VERGAHVLEVLRDGGVAADALEHSLDVVDDAGGGGELDDVEEQQRVRADRLVDVEQLRADVLLERVERRESGGRGRRVWDKRRARGGQTCLFVRRRDVISICMQGE